MPLPSGSITLSAGESSRQPKPAYLIKFPEDAWERLQDAKRDGGEVSVSLDGSMTVHIPNFPPLPLESLPTGSNSEIHLLSTSPRPSLSLQAIASTKLSVPISSASSARAADKLRAQTDAIDQERKERADRVNGVAKSKVSHDLAGSTAMGWTQSSPANGTAAGGPMIPLKTRVIQLLALGSTALGDIVSRVGGAEQDVIRVVNVVGRQVYPGSWGLQPAQYSKVKIASWKYTYAEKLRVVRLAREALDVLGLPVDADLRVELERKEAEVMSGASSSSSEEKASVPIPEPLPTPAKTAVVSPAPASAPISKKKTAQTLIGKQMAKFAKEKRASSMPNVKKADGTATPRTTNGREHHSTSPVKDHRDREKAVEAEETKEKLEVGNGKRKRDEKEKRKSSPVYTSSESDAAPKRKRTPEYSSSSGDEPKRRRRSPAPAPAKSHTRKPPTPELTLNGHTHTHTRTHVHAPTPRQPGRDPETMRDRYEELFPAYQQLTEKLARVHRAAEDGEDVGVGKEEVGKMVGKWGRWHAELAGIRVWFGEGEGS